MQRRFKDRYGKKTPAQILVWTIVEVDDITDLSDENIISMAGIQENWKVARP